MNTPYRSALGSGTLLSMAVALPLSFATARDGDETKVQDAIELEQDGGKLLVPPAPVEIDGDRREIGDEILSGIRVPELSFESTPIREALAVLQRDVNGSLSRLGYDYRIRIELGAIDEATTVRFSVYDLPAKLILDIISAQTSTAYRVTGTLVDFGYLRVDDIR